MLSEPDISPGSIEVTAKLRLRAPLLAIIPSSRGKTLPRTRTACMYTQHRRLLAQSSFVPGNLSSPGDLLQTFGQCTCKQIKPNNFEFVNRAAQTSLNASLISPKISSADCFATTANALNKMPRKGSRIACNAFFGTLMSKNMSCLFSTP